MRTLRRLSIGIAFLLVVGTQGISISPANAAVIVQNIAEDNNSGYDRSMFKHWIDADKNGCDTRKEVLIQEAKVKPKIGKKCALTLGTWVSSYDGKTLKGNGSALDVDHFVPLAEAWRSGAWQWTSAEREAFANDLSDPRVLIAVSASSNRSKSDNDPANWMPKVSKTAVCEYLLTWVAVKTRYALTYDAVEANFINTNIQSDAACFSKAQNLTIQTLSNWTKYSNSNTPVPVETPSSSPTATATPAPTPTPSPTPSATATKPALVKYKNCTEAKAAGVTPILKATNPDLYALNTHLDGDKDGDACES